MTEPRQIKRYGWIRQNPDWRDYRFTVPAALTLPRHVDLHAKCPPIWNQGNLGSCTAHGSLRAYVADRMRQGYSAFMPSRLMQYYDSRWLEGTTLIDVGATCRDSIKAIAKWGACPENLWPYDINKFNRKPPAAAYTEAAKHKAIEYQAVSQDLYSIKAALAQGFPIVFGFSVYQNFEESETTKSGLVYMPSGANIGGHCVCAVGYNSRNYLMFANSWGTSVGDPDYPGHYWMPPDYFLNPNLASDFWIIKSVQP